MDTDLDARFAEYRPLPPLSILRTVRLLLFNSTGLWSELEARVWRLPHVLLLVYLAMIAVSGAASAVGSYLATKFRYMHAARFTATDFRLVREEILGLARANLGEEVSRFAVYGLFSVIAILAIVGVVYLVVRWLGGARTFEGALRVVVVSSVPILVAGFGILLLGVLGLFPGYRLTSKAVAVLALFLMIRSVFVLAGGLRIVLGLAGWRRVLALVAVAGSYIGILHATEGGAQLLGVRTSRAGAAAEQTARFRVPDEVLDVEGERASLKAMIEMATRWRARTTWLEDASLSEYHIDLDVVGLETVFDDPRPVLFIGMLTDVYQDESGTYRMVVEHHPVIPPYFSVDGIRMDLSCSDQVARSLLEDPGRGLFESMNAMVAVVAAIDEVEALAQSGWARDRRFNRIYQCRGRSEDHVTLGYTMLSLEAVTNNLQAEGSES